MAFPTATRRPRILIGATLVAATAAGVITSAVAGTGSAHAAPASVTAAQTSCNGVTGELVKQNTNAWYSTTEIKLTNTTDAEKPFTLKVQFPGDAGFAHNSAWATKDVVSDSEATITGTVKANAVFDDTIALSNKLTTEHEHLHPIGEITLNGAPLGSCTGAGAEDEDSTELSAKTWSKNDVIDLYFADLTIPTGGKPADRYEIFVDGKLATTAIFGSSKLSKGGAPVKQLKQVLALGTKAGVEHKVKVRPIGHHPGAFTNEITITSSK